ncbi:MAG: Stk1 family PASTA domain-containing Ser/Thr kinase [Bacilli bacterium]|nr:Stk1 family PASTA domain-containing Ser/Thr kinase [Bacilli bacterium]
MISKGQKINDRYQVIRSIGEGGMANVYLAHDIILDRKVAVKVLRGDLASDDKFVRRFQREALSASSLSHPNIVEMYDVGEDNGKYYLVMEYIEGKTLKQLLKRRGFLTIPEVVDIMLQLTEGLAHAHDSYIVHRDIKPQNVLILENGLVKLTDFGIAVALNSSQLTQTNSVMGSVHYLPPEQASGRGSTIKSDIYSLGIIMYELLTGKLPFKGENAIEIALKQLKDQMPSIRKQLTDLPQSIENIILKSTAKNPKNRYRDAREMYEDLKTALDDDKVNQPRHVYKYQEQDLEETKVLPVIKAEKRTPKPEPVVKKIDDENSNQYNGVIKILSWLFLGLLTLMALGFILFSILTNKPDIKVPDVANLSVLEAEKQLKKMGFEVALDIIEKSSDDIPTGKVIRTNPTAGRLVKKGTKIILWVSTGSQYLEAGNYIGKNYNEVKALLERDELVVQIEKREVDNPEQYDSDEIIGQEPKAGTKLIAGDTVKLYIPNIEEKYPDMVKEAWPLDDVEAFAEKYGLTLKVEYQETDNVKEGTVISQSRGAGTVIIKGVTFKVVIAILPPSEPEPDGEIIE